MKKNKFSIIILSGIVISGIFCADSSNESAAPAEPLRLTLTNLPSSVAGKSVAWLIVLSKDDESLANVFETYSRNIAADNNTLNVYPLNTPFDILIYITDDSEWSPEKGPAPENKGVCAILANQDITYLRLRSTAYITWQSAVLDGNNHGNIDILGITVNVNYTGNKAFTSDKNIRISIMDSPEISATPVNSVILKEHSGRVWLYHFSSEYIYAVAFVDNDNNGYPTPGIDFGKYYNNLSIKNVFEGSSIPEAIDMDSDAAEITVTFGDQY